MALYHILPFTGLSRRKRGIMYGNIAHILESGIPILRGMEILEQQAHNRRFRYIFKNIKTHIQDGGNIGSAMQTMPHYFPEEETRMIAATETTGTVPITFQRLSEYLVWYSDIIRQVVFQSAYPMFLLVFAFIGVPVIIAVGTGQDPLTMLPIIAGNCITLVLVLILFKLLKQFTVFRQLIHGMVLYVPWVGSVVRQLARARFARTYECMVSAGVPYFSGLRQSADSCGNAVIQKRILRVIPLIEDGMSLSTALRQTHEFTPISLGILEVGEESGKMEECLRRFSHEEEQKAINNIQTMGKLLPPLLFVIIAVIVVLFVILPAYQSYFSLLDSIQ